MMCIHLGVYMEIYNGYRIMNDFNGLVYYGDTLHGDTLQCVHLRGVGLQYMCTFPGEFEMEK